MKNLIIHQARQSIITHSLNLSVDYLISPLREEYRHGDDTYDLPSETMGNFVGYFKEIDYSENSLSQALNTGRGELFASLCNSVKESPYAAPEKTKPLQRVRAHALMHGALTLIKDWLVSLEKDEKLKALVKNILEQGSVNEYMSYRAGLIHGSLSSSDRAKIFDGLETIKGKPDFIETKGYVQTLYASHFDNFVKSYY